MKNRLIEARQHLPIDDRDLLQANATVIAGILILLTIVTTVEGTNLAPDGRSRIGDMAAIVQAMFPFVISSFLVLFASLYKEKMTDGKRTPEDEKAIKWMIRIAKVATAFGFPLLIGSVTYFIKPWQL